MNSEMSFLRWGIPGWITILTYLLLYISSKHYDMKVWDESTIDGGLLAGVVAILGAIGVPLGYIIYQIYFFLKWKFFVNGKKIDKIMSGIKLYDELPDEREMKSLDNWKKAERTFNIYLSAYIEETKIRYDDIMRQYQSFKSRTDRAHGLGASFSGIIISSLIFFAFNGFESFNTSPFLITFICVILVSGILLSNYMSADRDSFEQMKGIIVDIEVARKIMKK